MRKMLLWLSAIALAAMMGCGPKGDPAAETAAVDAARSWLSLIDDGQYGGSWDQAAQPFMGAVSREQWLQAMQTTRQPLGTKLSREVKAKRYLTSLPGAPDGQYVVILFAASFQNKKTAIETVTPMREKDGTWRVSGYYIK
ncbi:DUF4019 domain-containing protein [bacterium]|nr:DUF4019 domain-containing protein [bacterium]